MTEFRQCSESGCLFVEANAGEGVVRGSMLDMTFLDLGYIT